MATHGPNAVQKGASLVPLTPANSAQQYLQDPGCMTQSITHARQFDSLWRIPQKEICITPLEKEKRINVVKLK